MESRTVTTNAVQRKQKIKIILKQQMCEKFTFKQQKIQP